MPDNNKTTPPIHNLDEARKNLVDHCINLIAEFYQHRNRLAIVSSSSVTFESLIETIITPLDKAVAACIPDADEVEKNRVLSHIAATKSRLESEMVAMYATMSKVSFLEDQLIEEMDLKLRETDPDFEIYVLEKPGHKLHICKSSDSLRLVDLASVSLCGHRPAADRVWIGSGFTEEPRETCKECSRLSSLEKADADFEVAEQSPPSFSMNGAAMLIVKLLKPDASTSEELQVARIIRDM